MGLLKIPKYDFYIPWFIFDITNLQLITSQTIPGDIKDSKEIFFAETKIPGLNYSPIQPMGAGKRKISMTLPLVRRNNTIGNLGLLAQFKMLRNTSGGVLKITPEQFNPLPKVLYYWGTGSAPMPCYVTKCDFTNKAPFVNQLANPQFTMIDIEMVADEKSPLYKMEAIFRKVSSVVGARNALGDAIAKRVRKEKVV